MNQIVSFSGGKDSTAMLHMMLERGEQIDAVIFFDTGWEFPQMLEHIDQVEKKTGIKIIHIRPKVNFEERLLKYGWPSPLRRWCTREKINAVSRIGKALQATECIGIAYDEQDRTLAAEFEKRDTRFPLVEWGIVEKEALDYCKNLGYTWGGLYDYFPRVSCYLCPLKSIGELKQLYKNFPDLWLHMLELDSFEKNRGYRGYETVNDLNKRFAEEEEQEAKQRKLFAVDGAETKEAGE